MAEDEVPRQLQAELTAQVQQLLAPVLDHISRSHLRIEGSQIAEAAIQAATELLVQRLARRWIGVLDEIPPEEEERDGGMVMPIADQLTIQGTGEADAPLTLAARVRRQLDRIDGQADILRLLVLQDAFAEVLSAPVWADTTEIGVNLLTVAPATPTTAAPHLSYATTASPVAAEGATYVPLVRIPTGSDRTQYRIMVRDATGMPVAVLPLAASVVLSSDTHYDYVGYVEGDTGALLRYSPPPGTLVFVPQKRTGGGVIWRGAYAPGSITEADLHPGLLSAVNLARSSLLAHMDTLQAVVTITASSTGQLSYPSSPSGITLASYARINLVLTATTGNHQAGQVTETVVTGGLSGSAPFPITFTIPTLRKEDGTSPTAANVVVMLDLDADGTWAVRTATSDTTPIRLRFSVYGERWTDNATRSLLSLTDTPLTRGRPGQVLAVNTAGDAEVWAHVRDLLSVATVTVAVASADGVVEGSPLAFSTLTPDLVVATPPLTSQSPRLQITLPATRTLRAVYDNGLNISSQFDRVGQSPIWRMNVDYPPGAMSLLLQMDHNHPSSAPTEALDRHFYKVAEMPMPTTAVTNRQDPSLGWDTTGNVSGDTYVATGAQNNPPRGNYLLLEPGRLGLEVLGYKVALERDGVLLVQGFAPLGPPRSTGTAVVIALKDVAGSGIPLVTVGWMRLSTGSAYTRIYLDSIDSKNGFPAGTKLVLYQVRF